MVIGRESAGRRAGVNRRGAVLVAGNDRCAGYSAWMADLLTARAASLSDSLTVGWA